MSEDISGALSLAKAEEEEAECCASLSISPVLDLARIVNRKIWGAWNE